MSSKKSCDVDSKVATVTKNGKIKAVGKGTCKIYVYAQNGAYKTITISTKVE